jgi:hypothetical protein
MVMVMMLSVSVSIGVCLVSSTVFPNLGLTFKHVDGLVAAFKNTTGTFVFLECHLGLDGYGMESRGVLDSFVDWNSGVDNGGLDNLTLDNGLNLLINMMVSVLAGDSGAGNVGMLDGKNLASRFEFQFLIRLDYLTLPYCKSCVFGG